MIYNTTKTYGKKSFLRNNNTFCSEFLNNIWESKEDKVDKPPKETSR